MKYWEIIADNLRNAGWHCGCISSTDHEGRQFWVVAAERSDAGRFIVHADEELSAFLELESAIQTGRHNRECDCPEPDEVLGNYRRQSQEARLELGLASRLGLVSKKGVSRIAALCSNRVLLVRCTPNSR